MSLSHHQVVTREAWLAARVALLEKEKALLRQQDSISEQRRALPWVKLDKTYSFDTPSGPRTLADLFEGRSQLLVKHFMFGPDWEHGCVGCSFGADSISGALLHLAHHDVSFVAVSRAPLLRIEAFRRRMGWDFAFVSSYGSDFNYDFHVSFTPEQIAGGDAYFNYRRGPVGIDEQSGTSVFYRDAAGEVFHTYSTYARGNEPQLAAYALLDLTPKGRNETVNGNLTDWVRHHDRYATDAGGCCGG